MRSLPQARAFCQHFLTMHLMGDAMDILLEGQGLTRRFQKKGQTIEAVHKVSFSLQKGTALGIVGASGSGKSTLARMAAGLLLPSEGELLFHGSPLKRKEGLHHLWKRLQMIFQMPRESFDPRWTLEESIREGLSERGAAAEQNVREAAEACQLPLKILAKKPYEVSGGECQRAAIARALVLKPEILVCDEITSALDPLVQREIVELLIALKKEKRLSFLFVSHDISLTERFCDALLIMHQGICVEQGAMEEILRHPKDSYTLRLLEAAGVG